MNNLYPLRESNASVVWSNVRMGSSTVSMGICCKGLPDSWRGLNSSDQLSKSGCTRKTLSPIARCPKSQSGLVLQGATVMLRNLSVCNLNTAKSRITAGNRTLYSTKSHKTTVFFNLLWVKRCKGSAENNLNCCIFAYILDSWQAKEFLNIIYERLMKASSKPQNAHQFMFM